MALVTLLTDFGTQDGYVGAMKGVIAALCPEARILDLTHEVPPQDVAAGAFALAQAAPYFPDGTVHCAVVDPGVGSERRGVVVSDGRQLYVGPDNGLFALAVSLPAGAWEITSAGFRRGSVSATFHGRDVFAAAAARLAAGARPEEAGPACQLAGALSQEPVLSTRSRVTGHIIHIDRFGNCITDIPAARLPETARVAARTFRVAKIRRTFSDVPRGKPVAYIGSAGTLELAVREGSAQKKHRLRRGHTVTVTPGS